ncbi:MAG TPA: single-stranded-DNA-specific exonuclease RecJ, partial [Firmicutes bacterium]|nr:single-stranded-DNA-specific exonuclease RecJ [Bacillota bacterium]
MLKSKTKWKLHTVDEVGELNKDVALHPLIQQLILSRQLTTPEQLESFLNDDLLHDPFEFQDMEKVVARIQEAIELGQPILIYGDYDADGVTATSILMRAITELGGMVESYIPNRFYEGYGPNEDAFMQAV